MSSCGLGHSVPPGAEFCPECGADVRLRCSQGHASRVGKGFCETCGEFLPPAEPGQALAAAMAVPALEYSSGSFADFIASTEDRYASPAVPTLPEPEPEREPVREPQRPPAEPDPALSPARVAQPPDLPLTHPAGTWRSSAKPQHTPGPDGGVHHDVAPRMPGAVREAEPPPTPQRPRRGRVIAVVALLAVVGTGGTVGALALHQHYAAGITAPPARPAPSAHTSPATGAGAPTSVQPASSPGWSSPFPVPPVHGNAVVRAISCPTLTACYAADSAGAILWSTPPGGWQKVATDAAGGLVAISCATISSCVAVDHSGNALVMAKGIWSSPAIVDTSSGAFTALSCPTKTFCIATDSRGAAYADTATGWRHFTVDTGGGKLTSVSCTSAAFCVAADNGGGVYTYDGSSWTGVSAIDPGHGFTAVSCATQSFCVAVDRAGNAAVFSHRKWAVAPMGTTALTVSCPAKGFCMATNGAGGALAYRGGRWSATSTVDGKAVIGSLTCASTTFCVAIDQRGEVVYYRPG